MRFPFVLAVGVISLAVLLPACRPLAAATTVRVRRGTVVTDESLYGGASAAIDRGVEDLACPRDDLMLVDLGTSGYRVEGCGEWYTYTCRHEICVMSERGELPRVATASTWNDEHIAAVATRLYHEVIACVPTAPEGLIVGVRLSRTGRIVLRDRGPVAPFTATAAACINTGMATVTLRSEVDEGRDVALEVRGGTLVAAVQVLMAE